MFSFLAPLSDDAETFSKLLGTQTALSGSVSRRNGNSSSQDSTTYQMIKKPLMTAYDIKKMKKGEWILMKTGMNPSKMKLQKLEDWGIKIDKEHPYKIESRASRTVEFADRNTLLNAIRKKYGHASYMHVPEQAKQLVSDEYLN